MHSWLLFSLAAPIFWGCANVLDGAARRHFVKDNMAMTWFLAVTRLPLAILFFIIGGFSFPGFLPFFGMLLTGILWLLPFILYYKAIEFEEPTRVALFLQTIPLTTLLIAWLLIGESLVANQWIAFLMFLSAGLVATLKHAEGKWRISKTIIFLTAANIMWALSDVLFKKFAPAFSNLNAYGEVNFNFSAAFAVDLMGGFLLGILFLFFKRGRTLIRNNFKNLPKRAWWFLNIDQIIGLCGSAFFAYALTLGKASLTAVILVVQPLSAFIFSILLMRYVPELAREDTSLRALLMKGFSFVLIMAGLLSLQY